jgi:hypothetical protein
MQTVILVIQLLTVAARRAQTARARKERGSGIPAKWAKWKPVWNRSLIPA